MSAAAAEGLLRRRSLWARSRAGLGRPARGVRDAAFADRPMRTRFAGLARGSQPAVVKLASFGGGARLGGDDHLCLAQWRGRRRERAGRPAARAVISCLRWAALGSPAQEPGREPRHRAVSRSPSRQDGRGGEDRFERARPIVRQALGDRAFAFAVTQRARWQRLRYRRRSRCSKHGGRTVDGRRKASAIVQQRLEAGACRGAAAQGSGSPAMAMARITAALACVRWWKPTRARCAMSRGARSATPSRPATLSSLNGAASSIAASRAMSCISSCRRAPEPMRRPSRRRRGNSSGRSLPGTVMCSHFTMLPVTRRRRRQVASGRTFTSTPSSPCARTQVTGSRRASRRFGQWRLTMAEKARAHGIAMEMTDRRDRASPPAYSRNQVRPMNRIGRTQHAGTSAAAQRRYDAKRDDAEQLSAHAPAARPMAGRRSSNGMK